MTAVSASLQDSVNGIDHSVFASDIANAKAVIDQFNDEKDRILQSLQALEKDITAAAQLTMALEQKVYRRLNYFVLYFMLL